MLSSVGDGFTIFGCGCWVRWIIQIAGDVTAAHASVMAKRGITIGGSTSAKCLYVVKTNLTSPPYEIHFSGAL